MINPEPKADEFVNWTWETILDKTEIETHKLNDNWATEYQHFMAIFMRLSESQN